MDLEIIALIGRIILVVVGLPVAYVFIQAYKPLTKRDESVRP